MATSWKTKPFSSNQLNNENTNQKIMRLYQVYREPSPSKWKLKTISIEKCRKKWRWGDLLAKSLCKVAMEDGQTTRRWIRICLQILKREQLITNNSIQELDVCIKQPRDRPAPRKLSINETEKSTKTPKSELRTFSIIWHQNRKLLAQQFLTTKMDWLSYNSWTISDAKR